MSQWSRRKGGGLPVRNLSLPIFFGGISEENQASEIREALKNTRYCSLAKTRTINLSCLAIKTLPVGSILSAIKEEDLTIDEVTDYEMAFTEKKIILNLEGNLLESVPSELFSVESIEAMLLRSNKLSTIPCKIGRLKNLHSLTLSNNPIKYLPIEILSLPINLFTVSNRHFMTEEEIDEKNKEIEFKGASLSELCMRNVITVDALAVKKAALSKPQGRCFGCNLLTTSTSLAYKTVAYKGENIPFSMRVCSEECKRKVLVRTETATETTAQQ